MLPGVLTIAAASEKMSRGDLHCHSQQFWIPGQQMQVLVLCSPTIHNHGVLGALWEEVALIAVSCALLTAQNFYQTCYWWCFWLPSYMRSFLWNSFGLEFFLSPGHASLQETVSWVNMSIHLLRLAEGQQQPLQTKLYLKPLCNCCKLHHI